MTLGDILRNIRSFFSLRQTPAPPAVSAEKPRARRISRADLQGSTALDFQTVYAPAKAIGQDMAMDQSFGDVYQFTQGAFIEEGLGFLGYAYLAQLTQRSEYRMICEIRAEEMTRKWIDLQYTGDDDDEAEEKLNQLQQALIDFKVRDVFRHAIEVDGYFGRAQIYLDTGATDNPDEINKPLPINKAKIGKGQFRGLQVVEPIWTYAQDYNTTDPLNPDFYRPKTWTVLGKTVHRDRLLTLVSKPVPDILKPAYAFGGIALSQMAKPYVDNWLRTRQSVSDLIYKFSVMVLQTNLMAEVMSGNDATNLMNRLELYTEIMSNDGIFAIDKDSEDMKNLAVPLSGLDKLQAQSQEQMASISRTPLVKLLGVTPSGLNASSDGEIRVYYDSIHAMQEKLIAEPLTTVLEILQLHLWGDIDPNITFAFVPLWQPNEREQAEIRKMDADTDVELVTAGILSPEESRARIAADKDSGYTSLDVSDVPDQPEDDEDGGDGEPQDQAA